MERNRKRQLYAVMFLDMVGYTALMQKNEAEAISKRDLHRSVVAKVVAKHNGEILQYFGDGTMCIFQSVVEAVKCGVRIQLEVLKPPQVPLRIGIHLGDIVIESLAELKDIYGDGVNIASRIESCAVPNSVLISDRVYDQIKNQPDLNASFMGMYELKNVENPIGLYAIDHDQLEVPSAKHPDGKGKPHSSNDPPDWSYVDAVYSGQLLPIDCSRLEASYKHDNSKFQLKVCKTFLELRKNLISLVNLRELMLGNNSEIPEEKVKYDNTLMFYQNEYEYYPGGPTTLKILRTINKLIDAQKKFETTENGNIVNQIKNLENDLTIDDMIVLTSFLEWLLGVSAKDNLTPLEIYNFGPYFERVFPPNTDHLTSRYLAQFRVQIQNVKFEDLVTLHA